MQNRMIVGLLTILLSACGAEIAYKRGATAQDLQAGKAACQKAHNEKELNQCLEDHGWAVHQLDGSTFSDDELFATVTDTKDNRMSTPKEKSSATIKTTENLKSETIQPVNNDVDTNTTATQKPTVSQSTASTKPKPSIFDIYVIKSWWKMGGNLTLLEQNMSQCNEQLGEAHYPNKKAFTFTRGFAICMRQKGWRGLIEK